MVVDDCLIMRVFEMTKPFCNRAVKELLKRSTGWKSVVGGFFGSRIVRLVGIDPDWQDPAFLEFVYEDDEANLPVHYIALGLPASR